MMIKVCLVSNAWASLCTVSLNFFVSLNGPYLCVSCMPHNFSLKLDVLIIVIMTVEM